MDKPYYPTVTTKMQNSYLNTARPLWILKDQVAGSSEMHTYSTVAPKYFKRPQPLRNFAAKRHKPFTHRPTIMKPPKNIKISNYYMPQASKYPKAIPLLHKDYKKPKSKIQSNSSKRMRKMPTFDSLPGDDVDENLPIFIYNGPKGEIMLNTMLSRQKYKMLEPVPGEVLYPPVAPIFRPKPIVERFKLPNKQEIVNLTLIPFYAHEAITTEQTVGRNQLEAEMISNFSSSTISPTVIYATSVAKRRQQREHLPTILPIDSQKSSKKYEYYKSPHEVQWKPSDITLGIPTGISYQNFEATTAYPMTLARPLLKRNHHVIDVPTTYRPKNNFKLTYKDDDDTFQIFYRDESVEKPSNRMESYALLNQNLKPKNKQSSKYTLSKEYYAFPVFTLGKLLKSPSDKDIKILPLTTFIPENLDESNEEVNQKNASIGDTNISDTWFIINSR